MVESNLASALSIELAGHVTFVSVTSLTAFDVGTVVSSLQSVVTIVFALSLSSLPVVVSKRGIAESVADKGQTTSHEPLTVRSPDPKTELPLIVLIFVPETRVSCFALSADCVALEIGLSASEVLSTLPKPTSEAVTVTFELKACQLTVVVFGTRPERSWSPVFVPVDEPDPDGAQTSLAVSVMFQVRA